MVVVVVAVVEEVAPVAGSPSAELEFEVGADSAGGGGCVKAVTYP